MIKRKMRKRLFIFLGGLLGSLPVLAQPLINLRLSFNAEANRYEVYAKSNFSASRYNWGPSQISVVLPASIADNPLNIRSNKGGVWLDQSAVFSPKAAVDHDFHGLASQGGKIDLIAGEEQLLFDFGLPQGYIDGVRLFDVKLDPGSTASGMVGGDFRSYIADERGSSTINVDARLAELKVANEAALQTVEENASIGVIAYPNPSPVGFFRLYLKGFPRQEVVRVQLSSLTGKLLNQFEESVETLAGRAISIPGSSDAFVLVTVNRTLTQQVFTQKLWLRQ